MTALGSSRSGHPVQTAQTPGQATRSLPGTGKPTCYQQVRALLGRGLLARGSTGRILSGFNGLDYGSEYLVLTCGECIALLDAESDGWAYAEKLQDGSKGWFPLSYWIPDTVETCAMPQVPTELNLKSAGQCLDSRIDAAPSPGAQCTQMDTRPQPEAQCTQVDTRTPPSISRSARHTYNRDFLLHARIALEPILATQEDSLNLTMCRRPQEQDKIPVTLAPPVQSFDDTVARLVQIAGGRIKIGNLAAAGLALGIMSGSHGQVCKNILATVQSRVDIFGPMPEDLVTTETNKLTVVLR